MHQQRKYTFILIGLSTLPGQDIWFCCYVTNALSQKEGFISEIVYVELLDTENKLVDRKVLRVAGGIASGDLKLKDSLANGNYTVRAYTNYLKNFDDSWFFQRTIAIQSLGENVGTNRDRAIDRKVNLRFFPEGGTFVAGFENRMAFKATNSNGGDVFVKGKIFDSNKKFVTSFESAHAGMGMVKLIPEPNVSYSASIELDGDSIAYALPEVEEEGYSLRVTDLGKSIKVSIVTSTKKLIGRDGYLIIQSNGTPHFSARGTFDNGSLVTYVKKELLPDGIAQVTILDDSFVPQCERLLFINHSDRPKISISFGKDVYEKREKIIVKGNVIDSKGLPVQGHFSMSVFDSDKIKDMEEYPSTIESSFLLTSDLKGAIHNPGYYFKDSLRSTKYHLDLLMMTHGWRRFTWKNVLNDSLPQLVYPLEKGLTIGGRVGKQHSKRKTPNSSIKILTSDASLIMVKTNELGEFRTDQLLYYDSSDLVIETDNERGEPQDMNLMLFPFTPSPPYNPIFVPRKTRDFSSFLTLARESKQVSEAIKIEQGTTTTLLKSVIVKSTRIEENRKGEMTAIGLKSNIQIPGSRLMNGYSNVIDAMKGQIPGVDVKALNNVYIIEIRYKPATLLLME